MRVNGASTTRADESVRAMCNQTETAEVESSRSGQEPAPLSCWPSRPSAFGELLTPVEAAQYLRLDETGAHTPESAVRTLNLWRDGRQLRATKYARRVWYRRVELDRFLELKTEQ